MNEKFSHNLAVMKKAKKSARIRGLLCVFAPLSKNKSTTKIKKKD